MDWPEEPFQDVVRGYVCILLLSVTSPSSPSDYLFKLTLVGDANVGKSSVMRRLAEDEFVESYDPTIGADFAVPLMRIDSSVVKLQLWDTSGRIDFIEVTRSYLRGHQGIILVYDVTNRDSFERIQEWMIEVENYACEDANLILLGNKADLQSSRAVSTEEGEALGKRLGALFFETSAKDGANVQMAFLRLAQEIKRRTDQTEEPDSVDLADRTTNPGKCY